jgi:hypothetical protein
LAFELLNKQVNKQIIELLYYYYYYFNEINREVTGEWRKLDE